MNSVLQETLSSKRHELASALSAQYCGCPLLGRKMVITYVC